VLTLTSRSLQATRASLLRAVRTEGSGQRQPRTTTLTLTLTVAPQEPENRDALRELHALKHKFKEHDRKEKKKFAGMFDRLSADADAGNAAAASSSALAPAPTPASAAAPATAASAQPPAEEEEEEDDDIGEPLSSPQAFEPTDVSIRDAKLILEG